MRVKVISRDDLWEGQFLSDDFLVTNHVRHFVNSKSIYY